MSHWSQLFFLETFSTVDSDSVMNPDACKLCVIDATYLIQHIFHSNDNDSVTELDDSTLE